ncbi:hypothetical protein GXB85_07865 [Cellulomonas sp. APG4]|uniref:hypothetical protein n=1 Tax=Cellulomonas sp. APG4 TaxID=1538656 RepID=UPI001379CC6E|nr:hypothetical protein [Cellulomonas sp. APG4]NCT90862.1 hypothetical protein [Cellulomonas sp. APG4]
MKTPKAAPWVLGTAFVAVLVLALTYLFLISPQLATAATARADAEAAEAQNVVHAKKLATLEEQFAQLDTYKAELAELRTQIPEVDAQPELLRQVQTAADAAEVFVVGSDLGVPEAFVGSPTWDPTAVPDPAAPADPAATGAEGEDGTQPAAPAAPEPTGVPGLLAVPFDVTVLGGYLEAVEFVRLLQESTPRLYVVNGFTVTGQDAAEASGGRPATEKGDVEVLVQGYVYVLQESAAASDESTTATTDATQN